MISLAGAALTPLLSSQALSRLDFDHPPVLQQTAHSYCLDSHFSPVNPSLVNKCQSLDNSASGSLSSKLVWQNPDRTNQPSPDPAEWVCRREIGAPTGSGIASSARLGSTELCPILDLEVFNDEEVFNLVLDDPLPWWVDGAIACFEFMGLFPLCASPQRLADP